MTFSWQKGVALLVLIAAVVLGLVKELDVVVAVLIAALAFVELVDD